MAGKRQDSNPADRPAGARPTEVSPWEWVAAAIGLVIVVGAIAFLSVQALAAPEGPPRIIVEVDTIVPADRGFLVQFTAVNPGHETVASLHVAGEIGDPTPLERSETVIDFVPARGQRSAGLFFTRDPRRHPLTVRPIGFDLP